MTVNSQDESRDSLEPLELARDREQRLLNRVVDIARLTVPIRVAPGVGLAHRQKLLDGCGIAGLRGVYQVRAVDPGGHR